MICIQQSSCYKLLFLCIIWYVVATDRATRTTTADTDEVTLNLSGKDNGIGYMNVRQNRKKYLHERFGVPFSNQSPSWCSILHKSYENLFRLCAEGLAWIAFVQKRSVTEFFWNCILTNHLYSAIQTAVIYYFCALCGML